MRRATEDLLIAVARAAVPDVIVMDLQMPETDGIEATRQVVAANSGIAVLVLTMFEDDASVFSAMRAGALGYLLKGAEQEEIIRAIHAAAHGQAIFGPAIAQRLIEFFNHPHTPTAPAFPGLTDREREVLDLIAAGQPNRSHQPSPVHIAEDGGQPRLEYLREASGRRSLGGHRPRQGSGTRRTQLTCNRFGVCT